MFLLVKVSGNNYYIIVFGRFPEILTYQLIWGNKNCVYCILDRIQKYHTNFLALKSFEYLPKNLRGHFRFRKYAVQN